MSKLANTLVVCAALTGCGSGEEDPLRVGGLCLPDVICQDGVCEFPEQRFTRVSGQIRFNGEPYEGTSVVWLTDGAGGDVRITPGLNGTYEGLVPPGTWEVRLGTSPTTSGPLVVGEAAVEFDVSVDWITVGGRLTVEGETPTDPTFLFFEDGERSLRVLIEPGQPFERQIPPGTYTLRTSPVMLMAQRDVVLTEDATLDLDLRNATLRGVIQGLPLDAPPPRSVRVYTDQIGGHLIGERAIQEGQFTGLLPAGDYSLALVFGGSGWESEKRLPVQRIEGETTLALDADVVRTRFDLSDPRANDDVLHPFYEVNLRGRDGRSSTLQLGGDAGTYLGEFWAFAEEYGVEHRPQSSPTAYLAPQTLTVAEGGATLFHQVRYTRVHGDLELGGGGENPNLDLQFSDPRTGGRISATLSPDARSFEAYLPPGSYSAIAEGSATVEDLGIVSINAVVATDIDVSLESDQRVDLVVAPQTLRVALPGVEPERVAIAMDSPLAARSWGSTLAEPMGEAWQATWYGSGPHGAWLSPDTGTWTRAARCVVDATATQAGD